MDFGGLDDDQKTPYFPRALVGWKLKDEHKSHDKYAINTLDDNDQVMRPKDCRWEFEGDEDECSTAVLKEDELGFWERQLLRKRNPTIAQRLGVPA